MQKVEKKYDRLEFIKKLQELVQLCILRIMWLDEAKMKEKNLSKTIEQSIWTPVLRKKLVTDTPVWIKRLRFQPPKKISKS